MTDSEALAHLQSELAKAKPGCFVPVSPTALSVVLAILAGIEKGESNDD